MRDRAEPTVDYASALLLGRALAFAANPPPDAGRPVLELCEDAAGDRTALLRADAVCRRRTAREGYSPERCQAHSLLMAARAAFDAGCRAGPTVAGEVASACAGAPDG